MDATPLLFTPHLCNISCTLSSNSIHPSEVKPIIFNRDQKCPAEIPSCGILHETPEYAITPLQCSV
jgi:hypothetical protein